MILDAFGGPGGWSEALRDLGLTEVGIELDPAACATRSAAGHLTIRADVATLPLDHLVGLVTGYIGSPPCPSFSAAGNRDGIRDLPKLRAHILACRGGWVEPDDDWLDPRTPLVLQPLRYILALRPDWIALEQVPSILPIWQTYAIVLEGLGYGVWCGELDAADYAVGQHRKRAILIANRGLPRKPTPSHNSTNWITMAEALGWGMTDRPYPTIACANDTGGPDREKVGGSGARAAIYREQTAGRWAEQGEPFEIGFPRRDDRGTSEDGYRERDWFPSDGPAPTITEKARSVQARPMLNTGRDWQPGEGREAAQTIDPYEQPAPTLTAKSGGQWQLNPGATSTRPEQDGRRVSNRRNYDLDEPAPTIAFGHDAAAWAWERPATTVQGDPRIWPPGHKINADDIARLGEAEAAERYGDRAGTEAVRLQIHEAALLQGFDADYPFTGNLTQQFQQVGNAVPPPLAAAIVTEAMTVRPRRARRTITTTNPPETTTEPVSLF